MPTNPTNRRRHGRVDVRLTARVSTIDPEPDPATGRPCFRVSDELCGNLSRGGAYVVTPDPIAPGRRVLLEMKLPDGLSIQAIGRVAWSKTTLAPGGTPQESGIGIEFLGTSPEQMSALEDFLTRSMARPSTRRRGPPAIHGSPRSGA